jgi:DNA-binding SARP family transcriptional activator
MNEVMRYAGVSSRRHTAVGAGEMNAVSVATNTRNPTVRSRRSWWNLFRTGRRTCDDLTAAPVTTPGDDVATVVDSDELIDDVFIDDEHIDVRTDDVPLELLGDDNRGEERCIARLLGPFEFSVDGTLINAWAGNRGRSVLKYLLAHRERGVRKETLMETFWPGAEPEASRNRLNVAISSLRRTVRPALGDEIVQHQCGSYRLNPALGLWLDVDQFQADISASACLERAGDLDRAEVALSRAIALYRGPFVEDDLYQEWTLHRRDQVHSAYLDALHRLGEIAFVQGRYDRCIELSLQLLAKDRCREETHCRLMRCYSRQARPHLALRQFRACVESLRHDLDVEPLADTAALFEAIRRHELV